MKNEARIYEQLTEKEKTNVLNQFKTILSQDIDKVKPVKANNVRS